MKRDESIRCINKALVCPKCGHTQEELVDNINVVEFDCQRCDEPIKVSVIVVHGHYN